MKLLLSKPRGFCAGVERAIETVKRALRIWGPPIFIKHEIVHNRHVIEELKALGAIFVEDLQNIPDGARVIFSAHGVPPEIYIEAKKRGMIAIDATCCLVTKVHSAAKRFSERGYHIILIGHRQHVETIGTAGEAYAATTIVETFADIEQLPDMSHQKVAYLTQTTLSIDDVTVIIEALKRRYPHIETIPSSSICYATTNRQMALRQIAQLADLVLVVGDTKSSNSNRLREVAENHGTKSYLINDSSEIDANWLQGVRVIAMTAGASTPEAIVQECVRRLQEMGVNETEEVIYTDEKVTFHLPKEVAIL